MAGVEYMRLAWATVRSHKLRSALTLLGIVIGVFAIIVAVTAVAVIRTSATETIESFGATTFTIESRHDFSTSGGRRRAPENLTYDQGMLYADRALLPVGVSPEMQQGFRVEARAGAFETEPVVIFFGSNEHWMANTGFELAEGRNLGEEDVQLARPVVVIGHDLEAELFPNEQAVGKDIVVDGYRYQVIGVFAEKGSVFGQNVDMIAVVPITRMINLYSAGRRDISVTVRAGSMQDLEAAMDESIGLMRVIRRVPPGVPNDFEVESNRSIVDELGDITGKIGMGGAAVGLITLFAAGIGIMNIMLVSVTERTREIGIRKAVGARRRDVLRQFLYEAIFLCQIGGIIGILVGAAGGNVIGLVFDMPFVFPWGWAIGAAATVTAVALVFGVYPATKAARLDPIESLRHE